MPVAVKVGGAAAGHNILSTTHTDAEVAAALRGALIYGNATPKWDRLAIGTAGKVLTSDGTDVSWQTPTAGGNFQLVQEQILSAAATNVDFTGLDINTDKAYMLVYKLKNLYSAGQNFSIFVEGDYTLTNYYSQCLYATGATVAANNANQPRLCVADVVNDNMIGQALIQRDVDGYFRYVSNYGKKTDSSLQFEYQTGRKTATVTNITSIRIHADQANTIAANSRFALYKVTGA